MKWIKFTKIFDFGTLYWIQILSTNKLTLFQFELNLSDYSGWPYLKIEFGQGCLASFQFYVYKFGFDVEFLSRTWKK